MPVVGQLEELASVCAHISKKDGSEDANALEREKGGGGVLGGKSNQAVPEYTSHPARCHTHCSNSTPHPALSCSSPCTRS